MFPTINGILDLMKQGIYIIQINSACLWLVIQVAQQTEYKTSNWPSQPHTVESQLHLPVFSLTIIFALLLLAINYSQCPEH